MLCCLSYCFTDGEAIEEWLMIVRGREERKVILYVLL
jgi:hypothetical protein